jgi:Na+(H+)/acetate symporter ActP
MQFLILLIGALVFSLYLFYKAPVFFNEAQLQKVYATNCTDCKEELTRLTTTYDSLSTMSQSQVMQLSKAINDHSETQISSFQQALKTTEAHKQQTRKQTLAVIKQADKTADVNDTNYIFLYFVVHHLPKGLIGLLIAVIFLAAWGSIAAALNSLASSTVIDLYKRMWYPDKTDLHYYKASKWITLFWGLFCIATAMFASQLGSLIEAVNVLGSLFYGTMLGIFVVAFYFKGIGSKAVFYAALLAEAGVITIYVADIVSFLWLNVIGCLLVVGFALLFQLLPTKQPN